MQYIYDKEKYVADSASAEDIKAIRKMMEQILAELRRGGEYVKVESPTQPLTVGDPRPQWYSQ